MREISRPKTMNPKMYLNISVFCRSWWPKALALKVIKVRQEKPWGLQTGKSSEPSSPQMLGPQIRNPQQECISNRSLTTEKTVKRMQWV